MGSRKKSSKQISAENDQLKKQKYTNTTVYVKGT